MTERNGPTELQCLGWNLKCLFQENRGVLRHPGLGDKECEERRRSIKRRKMSKTENKAGQFPEQAHWS